LCASAGWDIVGKPGFTAFIQPNSAKEDTALQGLKSWSLENCVLQ
jgi:hypothetical protein